MPTLPGKDVQQSSGLSEEPRRQFGGRHGPQRLIGGVRIRRLAGCGPQPRDFARAGALAFQRQLLRSVASRTLNVSATGDCAMARWKVRQPVADQQGQHVLAAG
jgi:hypothetical protein